MSKNINGDKRDGEESAKRKAPSKTLDAGTTHKKVSNEEDEAHKGKLQHIATTTRDVPEKIPRLKGQRKRKIEVLLASIRKVETSRPIGPHAWQAVHVLKNYNGRIMSLGPCAMVILLT